MQFMTSLLGDSQNAVLNNAFALGIVLVLIALVAWVLKVARRAGTGVVRGRQRRLTVVDSVQVDGRRQLLIVRRDNVEHLIMTGGPQDLVVESGIAAPEPAPNRRAPAPARQANEPVVATPPMPAVTPPNEHRPLLRRTGLLRPDTRQRLGVIPIGPALRIDNSAGPPIDSATPSAIHGGGSEARGDGERREVSGATTAQSGRRARLIRLLIVTGIAAAALTPVAALAQDVTVNFGDDTTITQRAVQLVGLITVLALAPSILIMVTSFTRIVVVLSLLRSAIGPQTAPPNSVMVSLALFLTFFIMQPTLQASYDRGIAPLLAGQIELQQAFDEGSAPLHDFMVANVREADLQLFFDMSNTTPPADATAVPLQILIPAFMISELRRAFEIGFLLFLPFVIIDMVVASVLMSMGMMMLPPVVISLPFKLIFFVLVDGWHLVAGSLVRSFTSG